MTCDSFGEGKHALELKSMKFLRVWIGEASMHALCNELDA